MYINKPLEMLRAWQQGKPLVKATRTLGSQMAKVDCSLMVELGLKLRGL